MTVKKEREFSCDNCGKKVTAYPPDDTYSEFLINECCEKSLKRSYECDNCNERNVRYWCQIHPYFAVTSGINRRNDYGDF